MISYANFPWLHSIALDGVTNRHLEKIESLTNKAEQGQFSTNKKVIQLKFKSHNLWVYECDAWFALSVYTKIFTHNPHNHMFIPQFFPKKAKTIIDLGANVGIYALRIKQDNPECKIIALEPSPDTFEVLKRNITTNNCKNIYLVNKAAASYNGTLELRSVDQVSAITGKYIDSIKKEHRSWLKYLSIKSLTVDCITLSKLFEEYKIKNVDLLKMDIEGMEFEVLDGSKEVLKKIDRIVVEWHSHSNRENIISLLEKHDFKLAFEEDREFGDLYFIKKKLVV